MLSGIGAAIFGFRSLKKSTKNTVRIIAFITIFAAFCDLTLFFLARKSINNLWIINFYELVLGLGSILFFYHVDTRYFRLLKSLSIIFTIIFLSSWFLPVDKIGDLNGLGMVLESLVLIFVSILFFYRTYLKADEVFIEKSPEFLIVAGILFYFSGALFTFLLWADILSQSPNELYHSWVLHNCANILKNLLFVFAFVKSR